MFRERCICLAWLLTAALQSHATPPLTFELSPKSSGGIQELRSVYAMDIVVDRDGPLSLLVDTGSPAVVVQTGETLPASAASSSFLGVDGSGSATIHYGGSSVTGAVSRSRVCLRRGGSETDEGNQSATMRVCMGDFPVFKVQQGDAAFAQLGLDGVLGLGPATGEKGLGVKGLDETVSDGLATSGSSLPRVFALYISPGPIFGPSTLSFGGYDETKIQAGAQLQYIPLAQPAKGRWELPLQDIKLVPASGDGSESVGICQGKTDCRALLDSGTSQLASVAQLPEALAAKFRNSASGECADPATMPDLHVEFAGGSVFKLGPEDYILNGGACSLAIDELSEEEQSRNEARVLILGQPFLRKVYTVFDQELNRIGLAPSVSAGSETQNEKAKEEDNDRRREQLMSYLR